MKSLTVSAPAKLNLFLAITGRRADGFHDLVSVVAPLDWGDTLSVSLEKGEGRREKETESREAAAGAFSLVCDDPSVPVDGSNLVLKAAEAFRAAVSAKRRGPSGIEGARFVLTKRIPVGAGLGGGSSDAAAALRALNELSEGALSADELLTVAATVGSDCPLFLRDGPVVMRGRGERVDTLPPAAAQRLRGRRVLVFKPAFGIATAWAYRQIADEAPRHYLPVELAEARLAAWTGDAGAPAEDLLFNSMEAVAFRKFPALPVLLERLRDESRLLPRMSGSGSACYVLLPEGISIEPVKTQIRTAWGGSAFMIEAAFAP